MPSETSPAHIHLRQLAENVKAGISAAGGVPHEFGVFSTCGNVGLGAGPINYELLIRDVLAASVEIMVMGHVLDGLVLMASCDSIIPGLLMGAARVNVPSIMVVGGPMLAEAYKGQPLTLSDINRAAFGRTPWGRSLRKKSAKWRRTPARASVRAPSWALPTPCRF